MNVRDARAHTMRAIQVVRALVTKANSISEREKHLRLFEALHRELSKLDSILLSQSNETYRALTQRFSDAKQDLVSAAAEARAKTKALGIATSVISSLTALAGAL